MSHDPLERATRALKDETAPEPQDLRRVRARVLASIHAEERRRSKRWVYVLPIAAALAATTAFAASTGELSAMAHHASQLLGLDEAPRPAPTAAAPTMASPAVAPSARETEEPTVAAAATPATTIEAPPATIEAPPPRRPPPAVPRIAPAPHEVAEATSAPRPSPGAAPDDASGAASAELASYRRAHALHFVDQDCARAVPAWETYLATAPSGAFVAEARYNRGICLAKLGRRAEARTALRPFADGAIAGGYRQRESRALLDALDADANAN